ncbi:conserved membrane hypothetical protein [Tenacibaculum litopenaei]
MKYLINIIVVLVNVVLYFALQIIGTFIHFFSFGSGGSADKYLLVVSIFMILIQLILLIWFATKVKFIKNNRILLFILCLTPVIMRLWGY